MRNGKNPLVWLAILVMVALIAFVLFIAEGARRKAQEDRPGGPVGTIERVADEPDGTDTKP